MDDEFTPDNLRNLATEVETLRVRVLLMNEDGADTEAEQFYMLGLNALDSASRYLKLASIKQSQGIR